MMVAPPSLWFLNQRSSSEAVGSGLHLNILFKQEDVLRAWRWNDKKEVKALTWASGKTKWLFTEMEKMADDTRKALDAKRTAEAESKKKRLSVSENEGADVL